MSKKRRLMACLGIILGTAAVAGASNAISVTVNGAASTTTLSDHFFGHNYWMWTPTWGNKVAGTESLIADIGVKLLRIGGTNVDVGYPDRVTSSQLSLFGGYCGAVHAEPLLQVQLAKYTTTADRVSNAVLMLDTLQSFISTGYVSIGNEPDIYSDNTATDTAYHASYLAGYSLSNYCADFNAAAAAIKSKYPSVKIIGPELSWKYDAWIPGFVSACKSNLDMVSLHYYPFYADKCVYDTVHDQTKAMEYFYSKARTLIDQNAGGANIPLIVGETNISWDGDPTHSVYSASPGTFEAGLWMADFIGVSSSQKKLFSIMPWSIREDWTLGFLDASSKSPKPVYYVYKMFSTLAKKNFFYKQRVNSYVRMYGYKDDLDNVSLFALNWDTVSAYDATIRFSGVLSDSTYRYQLPPRSLSCIVFSSDFKSRKIYLFSKQNQDRGIIGVPEAPTLLAPPQNALGQPYTLSLRWGSVADAVTYRVQLSTTPDFSGLIVDDSLATDTVKAVGPLSGYGDRAFYWRVRAKNAAAASGNWSPSRTFSTGTPLLLDDFEDGDNANKIGTYWYFWTDSFSVIHNAGPDNRFTGGYAPGNGSSYAGIMDFTIKKGSAYPEVGMAFNFDAAGDSVDLSGVNAVQFDAKASRPMVVQFRVPQSSIYDYNYYNAKINVDTSWTTVQVILTAMNTNGYGDLSQESWGALMPFEITKLTGLEWIFHLRDGGAPDSSGKISIDNLKLIGSPAGLHAPFAPLVIGPAWGAANQPLSPLMIWHSSAGAISYHLQLSKSQTFASFVVNQSGITDTAYQISGLDTGTIYYWRVNATGGGLTSRWSYATSFRTIGKSAIIVNPGWNMISLNIHPGDSSAQGIFGSLSGFILAKNNAGLVYWPAYGINNLDIHTGNGYKVYTDSLDTLQIAGSPINVATTPIPLSAGWNMTAYLPQSNMSIVTALSGVVAQITLVKDNLGQVYMPDLGINTIGEMQVGQGYKMHMKNTAVLTYPAGGIPKLLAEGKKPTSPLPGHYLFQRNTGSNATILAKQVSIGVALAADNSEIGVFDEQGNLVGGGVVVKGKGAFCVWGDDPQTKEKDGCAVGEKLSFKLWNGTQEYPIECQGMGLHYHEDGIYTAAFSVQGALFIKKFALRIASSNPFRDRMTILFDIPAINHKDAQDVEINIYGLNGRLVHQLIKGEYTTGHYSATWNIGNDALSGSNIYIVRMKAANFDNKLRLFQVK
jgi:hypothetical protein